eukprot:g6166.t1
MSERDEEDYEEETEEEVDEEEEHEMESKIKALEAMRGPAMLSAVSASAVSGSINSPDSFIPEYLKNPALDGSQSKTFVGGATGANQESVEQLKLRFCCVGPLPRIVTARKTETEKSQSQTKNTTLETETKNTILENAKNKVEAEQRELQRLLSGKEQNVLGLEETKRQMDQRLFRLEQDGHTFESELQNTQWIKRRQSHSVVKVIVPSLWKLKNAESKLEQTEKERAELERLGQKLQAENQDLGLKVLSVSGTTRVQQAEIENLHRDIRLANAEREESIKVAVSKNQMEQELLKLKEEVLEGNRQINLQANSLNQYKEECNRLNAEFARAQRQAEQWRKELLAHEDIVTNLREENAQMKTMESSWQKEIERLNATLIEDRKERYNRFAATSDLEPAVVRNVQMAGGFSSGVRPENYAPDLGRNYTGHQPAEQHGMKTTGDWHSLYGTDFQEPLETRGRGAVGDRTAGGSSPFISRQRSTSPHTHAPGREEHLGPYGRVFDMKTSQMEGRMIALNQERTSLEAVLMKYPTNSAGRTLMDRKNKQTAESRLLEVEKELSVIRGQLRNAKTLL